MDKGYTLNPLTKLTNDEINNEVHRIRSQPGVPSNYVSGVSRDILCTERKSRSVEIFQQLQKDGTIQYKIIKGEWCAVTGTGSACKAEAVAVLLINEATLNGSLV